MKLVPGMGEGVEKVQESVAVAGGGDVRGREEQAGMFVSSGDSMPCASSACFTSVLSLLPGL